MALVGWFKTHGKEMGELYLALVGVASIFIKIFPTLSAGNKMLGIIKFIGKWLALDKYGPAEVKRPTG